MLTGDTMEQTTPVTQLPVAPGASAPQRLAASLATLWSSTRFNAPELAAYATGHIER